MPSPIRFIQWNCRSIKNTKKESLLRVITHHKIDVVALSETWLSPKDHFKLPGFVIIRKDRSTPASNGIFYGGVLLAIKNNIFSSIISIDANSAEIVGCTITLNTKNVDIFCYYVPPSSNNVSNLFNTVCSKATNSLIMLGDPNAHSISWGCLSDCTKGEQVIDRVDFYDLVILNDGSITRLGTSTSCPSAIDLSICSNDLALDTIWKTIPDTMGSDHLPILIDLGGCYKYPPAAKERIDKTKHVDWRKFRSDISHKICEIESPEENLENYDKLLRIIYESARDSKVSNQRNCLVFNPQPWWNDTCDSAVESRMQATKLFVRRRCRSREDFENLKKAENAAHNSIQKEKKRGWHNVASNMDPRIPETKMWNIARSYCGKPSTQTAPNNSVIIEGLLDKLAVPYVTHFPTQTNDYEFESLSEKFTMTEFNQSLQKSKKSAVGIDGISYVALINLPDNAKLLLLAVFNNIVNNKIEIPPSWYDCVILAFLKPSKDPSVVDSYRPISLLSCIRKTFERLLCNRLNWWLEKNSKLSTTQFGFRQGKGTRDAMALLHSNILDTFSDKQNMLALFVDISMRTMFA